MTSEAVLSNCQSQSRVVPVGAEQLRRVLLVPQELRGQARPLQQLGVLRLLPLQGRGRPSSSPAPLLLHLSRKTASRKDVALLHSITATAGTAARGCRVMSALQVSERTRM